MEGIIKLTVLNYLIALIVMLSKLLSFNFFFNSMTLCRYIKKELFIEVGKDDASPSFNQVLELLLAKGEFLAFAPNTTETRMMINILSFKFPLLKVSC